MNKKPPLFRQILILSVTLGLLWITIHIFLLPFFPWSTGMVRSWLLLHGYIPFRDLTWLRTPFDLFLMAGWFRVFGVSDRAYQLLLFTLHVLISFGVLWVSYNVVPKKKIVPYIFYLLFLFPLFQNAEIGEVLIALYAIVTLGCTLAFFDTKNGWFLFLSGFLSGLGVITKQTSFALVAAPALSLGIFLYRRKQKLAYSFRRYAILLAGFLIPIVLLIGYYAYQKGLSDLLYYTITVVLSDYRRESLPVGILKGEGMLIAYAYGSLLIPFVVFWKQTKLAPEKVILVASLIIFLLPSLFPSYLSYRTITAYPIVSIIFGYNILLFLRFWKSKQYIKTMIILAAFGLFVLFSWRFILSYISSVKDNGLTINNIIKDYGENEYNVAQWIQTHTAPEEKIISITHPIVYLLSNRLPKNKYIDTNPIMLYPFEYSSKIFMTDPPRILVFEETLLPQFPHYPRWEFYQYFRKNYAIMEKFGPLTIYERVPSN